MDNSLNWHSDATNSSVLLRHDGSVTGCLCAVAWAQAHPASSVSFVPADAGTQDLFAPAARLIPSDPAVADAFLAQLQRATDRKIVRNILYALQVQEPGMEAILFAYTGQLFQHGKMADRDHANPHVARMHRLATLVTHEIHRMKGLLRFSRLRDGRFLAMYEPDHDITLPLAWHFARRLASQAWIILDAGRRCAATWDTQTLNRETDGAGLLWGDTLANALQACEPDPEDTAIQSLWRTFHAAIAIETRNNRTLQQRSMPVRYWKYLTEMQASDLVL